MNDQGVRITTPEDLARGDSITEKTLAPAATIGNVAAASRQFAEVKGAIQLAREFPRDEIQAFKRMRRTCSRAAFADDALYAFPRGDSIVSGASIRLIEELVRCYRNIDYGFRIMEMRDDRSLVEAFAWDVENNIKARREFWVLHIRETKSGSYPLTSPRDIYELCANMAQRRVRACVEEMLPVDLLEESKILCKKAMAGGDTLPLGDRVRNMVVAFSEIGVDEDMLEQRLGHPLKAVVVEELPKLKQVYNSIKDGLAKREDFFTVPGVDAPAKDSSNEQKKQEPTQGAGNGKTEMTAEERAILEKAKQKTQTKKGAAQEPDSDGDIVDPESGECTPAEPGGMTAEDIAEAERLEREEAEAFERDRAALDEVADHETQDTGGNQNGAQEPAEAPAKGKRKPRALNK